MELNIRGRGLQPTPPFRDYVERQLRHAFHAFDIDRATVRLIRDHGRGPRAAYGCEIAIALHHRSLRVNETHSALRVAFVRATSKARRLLVRFLHRARRRSRVDRNRKGVMS